MNPLCDNTYTALLCEPLSNVVEWPWWKILALVYGLYLFVKILKLIPVLLAIIPNLVLRKRQEQEERRRQARHVATPPL